jgi:isopentenyl diphosphate isomerase/L-lactate dehydrogenase-like FMN-dependent dehydrogenase
MANFGDFQNEVYAEAVQGVTTRYPFDFASIERKASEALPDWVYRYVSAAAGEGRTQRANVAAFSCYGIVPRMMVSPPERDLSIQLFGKHLAHPLSREDLRWIRSQTKLPLAIKGIQHPDDARLAIDNGADVLYCTNHGGRQANSAVSTLQLLPGVVKAASSTPVMFDSGVRSATDAIIALALGATAVGLGRPYAYALSYGGAESLTHDLRSFLAELDLCLAVCGFKDIATLKEAGVEEVINARALLPS